MAENSQDLFRKLAQVREELKQAQARVAELEAYLATGLTPSESPNPLSERRFQKLIEYSSDHIALTDTQGEILYTNPVAHLLGYSVEEYRGLEPGDLLHPADRPKAQGFLQALRATPNATKTFEVRSRHQQGHYVWIEVTATNLLYDPDIGAIISNSRDITERKQAEETLRRSYERFRLLVEGVADYALYLLDPNGYVVSWNAGGARLKGYREAEIRGRHFSCFFTAQDIDGGEPQRLLDNAAALGHGEAEGWRVRKDGSRFWANVVVTALRNEDNSLSGFAKITRDLTQRKHAEEQRRKLTRTLGVLSAINQAIVRVRHLPTLMEMDARRCHPTAL
jgi:PAS domain S-box-containing protein